jgi:hypothetical protein
MENTLFLPAGAIAANFPLAAKLASLFPSRLSQRRNTTFIYWTKQVGEMLMKILIFLEKCLSSKASNLF